MKVVSREDENKFLDEQLYPEIMISERNRVTILAVIALLTTLVFVVYIVFFGDDIKTKVSSLFPLYLIAGVFTLLFIRELVVRSFIGRKYEQHKPITTFIRYVNTFMECSFPAVVLILGIIFWNNTVVLYSPVVFLFFFNDNSFNVEFGFLDFSFCGYCKCI